MKCQTRYVAIRLRRDDTFMGPSHGADNDHTTICGINLNEYYYITHNDFDGTINCKRCLKFLKGADRCQTVQV